MTYFTYVLYGVRKSRGLKGAEVADKSGIALFTLYTMEGKDPNPKIGTIMKVMKVLGVSQERMCALVLVLSERINQIEQSGVAATHEVKRALAIQIADEASVGALQSWTRIKEVA